MYAEDLVTCQGVWEILVPYPGDSCPYTNTHLLAGEQVVSKTKHSKTKTEAQSTQILKTKHPNLEKRSTQNSKTKHPKLENEDP